MTDKAFLSWIRTLPSCISGKHSQWLGDIGEWRNPACHVRRAGKSGTAYKPEYSAIPLTNLEHDIQSRNGELACLQEFLPADKVREMFDGRYPDEQVRIAKNWFDAQAEKYFDRWVSETPEGRRCAREEVMV